MMTSLVDHELKTQEKFLYKVATACSI